jgi:hypothetical protein
MMMVVLPNRDFHGAEAPESSSEMRETIASKHFDAAIFFPSKAMLRSPSRPISASRGIDIFNQS